MAAHTLAGGGVGGHCLGVGESLDEREEDRCIGVDRGLFYPLTE